MTSTVGSIIETVGATRKKDAQKLATHKVLGKLVFQRTRLASRPPSRSPSLTHYTPGASFTPYVDHSLSFTNVRLNIIDCNSRPRVPKWFQIGFWSLAILLETSGQVLVEVDNWTKYVDIYWANNKKETKTAVVFKNKLY